MCSHAEWQQLGDATSQTGSLRPADKEDHQSHGGGYPILECLKKNTFLVDFLVQFVDAFGAAVIKAASRAASPRRIFKPQSSWLPAQPSRREAAIAGKLG